MAKSLSGKNIRNPTVEKTEKASSTDFTADALARQHAAAKGGAEGSLKLPEEESGKESEDNKETGFITILKKWLGRRKNS